MRVTRYIAGTALTLALTGCAVQEMEVVQASGQPFAVFAVPVDTRTVNNGWSTLWQEGDRFSLFHAAAGSTAYVSDGVFAIDNADTGHARGTVSSLGDGSFDWYMAYPYASSTSVPTAIPVTVGAAAGTPQVQESADDMSHLAGEGIPVTGRITAVPSSETPSFSVAPAVSVIAVNVTNPGEQDVTVEEVRFQAPEAIVGTFRVDVTGDQPVFTPVDASDEAVLSVSGDATIRKEENAVFYLAVKPFVAAAGSSLTLTVNGQSRTVTLTRAYRFDPGLIKTLTMTLDPSDPPAGGTYFFKQVSSFSPGKKYILVAPETDEDGEIHLRKACAIPESRSSSRLSAEEVTAEDGVITLSGLDDAFTFYESENGTLIRQADGRYLYAKLNNNNFFAGTAPGAGYYWTVSFDNQGLAQLESRQLTAKYNPVVGAFQMRKSTDSGILPALYELQNSDDAVAAFLENTVPGVYAYEGADWLYEDGRFQISVRTSPEEIAFRMYEPSTFTVIQLTGLPVTIAENDRLDVHLVRYVKQAATHSSALSVQVVHIADGKAWLIAGNGTGFIVNIQ